ncbi:DUF6233 domain-containing protein [Streptomyces sp. NPDC014646]|uniref:DUF6233 domain-containing protein n=1 Tax=Streptomyces sp. NPDC014646 TaxID=3364877 RepID=UPI0036F9C4AC
MSHRYAGYRRGPGRPRCGQSHAPGRRRTPPASRQQAIDALRQQVPLCLHCRPDTALGILDQELRQSSVLITSSSEWGPVPAGEQQHVSRSRSAAGPAAGRPFGPRG